LNPRIARLLLAAALFVPGKAFAQKPLAPEGTSTTRPPPAVSSTLELGVLQDLPASATALSILETTQPEAIPDRFYTGGLSTGQPGRFGAFLTSPAQTLFRLDGVNITDPDGSGMPMLFPGLQMWQRMTATSALIPVDVTVPGFVVTFEPRRPDPEWVRVFEVNGAPSAWVTSPSSSFPPVSRLDHWAHGSGLISGPLLRDRLGIVAGGSWSRGSQFQRGNEIPVAGTVGSGFAHAVWTPSSRSELRTLGWAQRSRYPYADRQPETAARDTSIHIQSAWDRWRGSGDLWRLFGAYTQRRRELAVTIPIQGVRLERLVDGPVSDAAGTGDTLSRRITGGFRFVPVPRVYVGRRHALEFGVDVERTRSATDPGVIDTIGELVDGIPARIWRHQAPDSTSRRQATVVAAYVRDEIALGSRAILAAGLRYDGASGSAEGSSDSVSWHSILPRVSVRWQFTDRMKLAFIGGYARTAYALPLGLLAYGDPAAPTADVFRWNASAGPLPALSDLGPLVARVGPGTGHEQLTSIDPDLRRPYSNEIVIGMESRIGAAVYLGLAGIAKWESEVVALSNTGVGAGDYVELAVDHPDEANPPIPIFNRLPSSFGRDRYLVTNAPVEDPGTAALEFTIRATTGRLFFQFGGTAQRAFAPAANRGFHVTENDQGVVGELLTNPNAATNGTRVRPFVDRGYTAKATLVYRLPADFRLGVAARYTDGQPFAGVVVVPGLNQGAEAVRGFAEGGTRFTYTATLDVRLQKAFRAGAGRLTAFVDVYNLTNHHHETEERTVLGEGFRTVTVIQPPRSVHVGGRLAF
jgi:hypothetical protein